MYQEMIPCSFYLILFFFIVILSILSYIIYTCITHHRKRLGWFLAYLLVISIASAQEIDLDDDEQIEHICSHPLVFPGSTEHASEKLNDYVDKNVLAEYYLINRKFELFLNDESDITINKTNNTTSLNNTFIFIS